MQSALIASIGMLAAIAISPVLASDRDRDHDRDRPRAGDIRPADGLEPGMQSVSHNATPGEPGHGWQYFSDATARRAVVISPQGDYYYSRGKGLRWVAAAQPAPGSAPQTLAQRDPM